MKRLIDLIYICMCNWLLVASVGRVALQLQGDIPLDALPFISFGLGATGLAAWYAEPIHTLRGIRKNQASGD